MPRVGGQDFNPRSPYGERQSPKGLTKTVLHFNPRSPYGERLSKWKISKKAKKFQSTLPLRGATDRFWAAYPRKTFQSTLPLRGATQIRLKSRQWAPDFNPRSPYGERHKSTLPTAFFTEFQSTLPLRGATWMSGLSVLVSYISIHAPLTGSDHRMWDYKNPQSGFQSTLPLRGATRIHKT